MGRPRVLEDVFHLLVGEAGVDGHHDRAGHLGAEEREHPVDAVAQPVGHAVAGGDALRAQPAGHAGRAVPQLAVAQPRPAELDQRLEVGVLLHRRAQHRHQRPRAVHVARDAVRTALDPGVVEPAHRQHLLKVAR